MTSAGRRELRSSSLSVVSRQVVEIRHRADAEVAAVAIIPTRTSSCSASSVPTILMSESRVGKIPITRVRRLISLCRRSIGLVECSRRRCSRGKCRCASTSSAASSRSSAACGNRGAPAAVPHRAAGPWPRSDRAGRTRFARSPRPSLGRSWGPWTTGCA
jgi:hypothetical protein